MFPIQAILLNSITKCNNKKKTTFWLRVRNFYIGTLTIVFCCLLDELKKNLRELLELGAGARIGFPAKFLLAWCENPALASSRGSSFSFDK